MSGVPFLYHFQNPPCLLYKVNIPVSGFVCSATWYLELFHAPSGSCRCIFCSMPFFNQGLLVRHEHLAFVGLLPDGAEHFGVGFYGPKRVRCKSLLSTANARAWRIMTAAFDESTLAQIAEIGRVSIAALGESIKSARKTIRRLLKED